MTEDKEQGQTPVSIVEHYRRKFARSGGPMLESLAADKESPSFNESEVMERLGFSKEGLYDFIENYLDNNPELKTLADKVIKKGEDPLRAVANADNDFLKKSENTSFLEVLVKTDGSRPSFLIHNGEVDIKSSPIGEWKEVLKRSAAKLKRSLESVGRINIGLRHVGTGFLIHRDLLITNRHVLQGIAIQKPDGSWELDPDANIDFGYEFKGRGSVNPRSLKKLIFCGAQKIEDPINHSKLDLALIEMESVPDELAPQHILSWDESADWARLDTDLFTIGYPGPPNKKSLMKDSEKIFDLLFKKTYGFKRLAPGKVLSGPRKNFELRLSHDATTLGGNSGSVILMKTKETIASGLHYGGDLSDPRENWGHLLGNVMNIKNADDQTLREYLDEFKVEIVKSV